MRTYRRHRQAGGTYFFTVNLAQRGGNLAQRGGNTLLVDRIDALREAFRRTRHERPFMTLACVVLPDHLHCVWRLPPGDDDFATRWRLIKSRFSRALAPGERRSASRLRAGERGIWQRRYWEHCIRDEADLAAHVDYVHINPLKHGLVGRVADWPWSTFHRDVRAGTLQADWGGGAVTRAMVGSTRSSSSSR